MKSFYTEEKAFQVFQQIFLPLKIQVTQTNGLNLLPPLPILSPV